MSRQIFVAFILEVLHITQAQIACIYSYGKLKANDVSSLLLWTSSLIYDVHLQRLSLDGNVLLDDHLLRIKTFWCLIRILILCMFTYITSDLIYLLFICDPSLLRQEWHEQDKVISRIHPT